MIFRFLFFYIIGYLNIEIQGAFLERFINMCRIKGIFLWNTKIEKGVKLTTNIGIRDFKNLREIIKRTNVKIMIKKKRGMPFLIHRYKKRKLFIIMAVAAATVLIVSSNFIWNIDISGNEKINSEDLKNTLEQEGLRIGTYKYSIHTNEIINSIRLKRDDIAWIGITITGTNLKVKIKEAVQAPKIINQYEYCNIIADKDGMITKVSVENGTANVKEGDIVKKGDILAKGYLEGKYTGIRYVHARANVEAKVWYSKKEKVFLKQQIPTDTGKKETKYSILLNNFRINFYKTLSKFKNYDTIIESKKIRLFSNFYLPIDLIKTTNKEYTLNDITYTEEEITRNYSKKNRRRIKASNSK